MALQLANLADATRFGAALAPLLTSTGSLPVFLRGELGAGKTALVRAIVSRFKGAEQAEIASPSFNIINRYPTEPPTIHCDLYRCGENVPDEILDALEEKDAQVFVEWAEYFPLRFAPRSYLDIELILDNNTRLFFLNAYGAPARSLAAELRSIWEDGRSRL